MINYDLKEIRNIAFLGHMSSGKTSLIESMLYMCGVANKQDNLEHTVSLSVSPVEFKGHKYNIIDTPGYLDFFSEVNLSLRVVGGGVIVVDALSGIEVGTKMAWNALEKYDKPRFIFINKMDIDTKNYYDLLANLKQEFGKKIAPFCVPIIENEEFVGFVNVVEMIGRIFNGVECVDAPIPDYIDVNEVRQMLLEAVAEVDDKYMEKYFAGEEFSLTEIMDGLHRGVVNGNIVPVLIGSANKNIGIRTFFTMLYNFMPTPSERNNGERSGLDINGNIITRKCVEDEKFSAIVFKTFVDPFIGKISLFKVNSGVLKKEMEVLNSNKNKKEKIGQLFFMRNKLQIPTDEIRAGDIGATMKLQYTQTNDTLCAKDAIIIYEATKSIKPVLHYAIFPVNEKDDEKLSTALQKIIEEDVSIEMSRLTSEIVIGCHGEKHLENILEKLDSKYGVKVKIGVPKVVYKETIIDNITVQGKHKKQSGGSGQYGDVHITFEPTNLEFKFVNEIKGGVIPKQFIPAVEKGILEAMGKGSLGGFEVTNIKATLFDGSTHSVDSNEMSFKLAGILAFRIAQEKAKFAILEPIMKMNIYVDELYVGDVTGDLNKRRGKILGINHLDNNLKEVIVEVPYREILRYALDLKALTHSTGSFNFDFHKYERLPDKLVDAVLNE